MSTSFPRSTLPLCLLGVLGLVAGCTRESTPPATRGSIAAREPLQHAAAVEPRSLGRRIALVLGNAAYETAPLLNPANDAALVAATLTELGFEVRLLQDGDQKAMKRAIQEFGVALEQGGVDSVGLFYYAGHGVQLSGRNYLIPVGASIARDADVEIEAVSTDWVLEQMRYARNRLNFVILDACRNNPFARSFRSAASGLAKMDAPAGVLIAYSTAPGDVAADGEGGNSPYTEALARAMRASGEPAELMFKQVRNDVRRATGERQTPWESSSLTGQNFYFASAAPGGGVGTVDGPSAAPSAASAAATEPPWFVEDPLCRVAIGRWRVEGEGVQGFVTLDERAGGIAKVTAAPQAGPISWECDPGRGELFVRYRGGAVHKLRAAGDEKLMFGYDQSEQPAVYTR